MKKAKEKFMNWWNKHKEKMIIIGVAIGSALGGIGATYFVMNKDNSIEDEIYTTTKPGTFSLEKPDWGDQYYIWQNRQEYPFCRSMVAETLVQNLGDFGEKLIDDCEARHDDYAMIHIEYPSNE